MRKTQPTANKDHGSSLGKFVVSMVFLATLAGSWDTWWHVSVGRDTLFEPPHLLLYGSAFFAIVASLYSWYITKERAWKRLAIIMGIVPLTAPFDEFWHKVFGVEDLSSPLLVWSPPHMAVVLCAIVAFYLLLPIIRNNPDKGAVQLFGTLCFAGMLSLFYFLALPLRPLGPWELIGFWGAGVFTFIFVMTICFAKQWLPHSGGGFLTASLSLLVYAVNLDNATAASQIIINPYMPSPLWLVIFSALVGAVIIDVMKTSLWMTGLVAGFVGGNMLYGFSLFFLDTPFQYSTTEATIAVFSSTLGGLVAGIFLSLLFLHGNFKTKNEKLLGRRQ